MAHIWEATYTIKDTGGITTTGKIRKIPAASTPTLAKMLTMVTALKAFMNGGVLEYSLFDWDETPFATPTITDPEGLNSVKALITFQYVNGSNELIYDRCYLPNPDVANHFEMVAGEGYRMLAASQATLETAMSTVTGLTISIIEVKLVTQSGHHARTASCVMFKDSVGALCPMNIPLATTGAALATFAGALDTGGFSRSTVYNSTFLTKTMAVPDPSAGIGLPAVDAGDPAFTSVETRATLKFGYLVGAKKKYMSVILPSVKNSSCVTTEKKKDAWKFVYANGGTVAGALNTMFTGGSKTVAYRSSKVKIKDLQTIE